MFLPLFTAAWGHRTDIFRWPEKLQRWSFCYIPRSLHWSRPKKRRYNGVILWENFKEDLSEDNYQHGQLLLPHLKDSLNDEFFSRVLINSEDLLVTAGGNDLSFYGLPKVTRTDTHTLQQVLFRKQLTTSKMRWSCFRTSSTLTTLSTFSFVNAPGRTGKTFLTKLLLAKVR